MNKTLVLPTALLLKNGRDKLHWRERNDLKKSYKEILMLKYKAQTPPQVRQKAVVTRIKGPRERDFDLQNIGAGSAVELLNAMTAVGYWLNDSPKWLETEFRQAFHPTLKGPAVLVEITAG